jgi:excisionase family DNA binding protein
MALPDTLDTEEIAQRLALSPAAVRAMIRADEIPGVLRRERPFRVSRAAFERWIEGRNEG